MTKQNWLNGFSIVIEPAVDRIVIPLSTFTPFVEAVADVGDDYDIDWKMMDTFLDIHRDEIKGLISEKISIQSTTKPWTN